MDILIPFCVACVWITSVIWVYRDANRRYELGECLFSGTFYAILCLFFWIPVFPIYVCGRILSGPSKADKPRRAPEPQRMPCPRCGESIPVAARECRFCNLELSTASTVSSYKAHTPMKAEGMKVWTSE